MEKTELAMVKAGQKSVKAFHGYLMGKASRKTAFYALAD